MYKQMSTAALDIITALTFVSYIGPGYKINVKSNTVIEAESHIGSLTRYISGESRRHTAQYINDVITRAIDLASKEDENSRISIVEALRSSIEGINNLMVTYEKDKYIVAKLTSESLRIEHFIRQIDEILR